jgi:dynein light intermediate chain
MAISAYETLYGSSIAYGIRKALMAEQRRTELTANQKKLAASNLDVRGQIENLKKTIEATQARAVDKRESEEKAHKEEVSV